MNLSRALRLPTSPCLALVGSGGKTTALFQLARELQTLSAEQPHPIILTATTHLHVNQIPLADTHHAATCSKDLPLFKKNDNRVTLITGPVDGDRTTGLDQVTLLRLHEICQESGLPLLIEADGSRQRPLKAPAEHEPVIPDFAQAVVVLAGLAGLGKPLTDAWMHRPEIFTQLSGLPLGRTVTADALISVLCHPSGGLKGIPKHARRIALLNQADTADLQAQAKEIAQRLPAYDAVVIASLKQSQIHAVCEPVAGILLAAGEASRFGRPKQLIEWRAKPFVRHAAEAAIAAGLWPVIVVTGAHAEAVVSALQDLPLEIRHNPDWQSGQSSSLQTGLQALPPNTGAAIFLLSDQPQVTPMVLRALVELHSLELCPVVAPQVQGQRANPVLFDRDTFPDLMSLKGDVGGRAIFSRFPVTYLPWHDENLLVDVDRPEDMERLR